MKSSSINIAVTSPSFSKHKTLRAELLAHFPLAKFNDSDGRLEGAALFDFLQGSRGVVVGLEKIDHGLLSTLGDLGIVSKYGVGLDNIDLNAAQQLNKKIGWVPGVNRRSVSELALAYMLGLARNVFVTGQKLKGGVWDKSGGFQLSGKTLGLVGCGFIGEDLLRLLQPFHMNILVCDVIDKRHTVAAYGGKQVSFEEVLRQSDIVSLHVPYHGPTHHMMNHEQLAMMKPTAYLINTSRGPVVSQEALKAALIAGKIAGAALDVFEIEPPVDQEFIALPQLVCTPHIGGNAEEAVLAMGRAAIQNLVEHFEVV